MSAYLGVLAVSGILPLVLSFYPPLRFYKNKRALLFTTFYIVLFFGSWDMVATGRGHWYFNPEKIIGVWIGNLPLEEWLFFIVIPFCCLFSWEVVNYFKKKKA